MKNRPVPQRVFVFLFYKFVNCSSPVPDDPGGFSSYYPDHGVSDNRSSKHHAVEFFFDYDPRGEPFCDRECAHEAVSAYNVRGCVSASRARMRFYDYRR